MGVERRLIILVPFLELKSHEVTSTFVGLLGLRR